MWCWPDHQQRLAVGAPAQPEQPGLHRHQTRDQWVDGVNVVGSAQHRHLRHADHIGNAATDMTAGFSHQTPQADGSLAAEPTFDVGHVARAVAHLVDLPLDVSVPSLTVMARAMPYFGRG
jgi:hypothetical protein